MNSPTATRRCARYPALFTATILGSTILVFALAAGVPGDKSTSVRFATS